MPQDKGKPVKFIRVRGRVVPIYAKSGSGGEDLRTSATRSKIRRGDTMAAAAEAKKHTRVSQKARVRGAIGFGVTGGIFGSGIGASLGAVGAAVAGRSTTGMVKATGLGALAGGLLAGGTLAHAAYKAHGAISERQFNKALKKRIAKRSGTSV